MQQYPSADSSGGPNAYQDLASLIAALPQITANNYDALTDVRALLGSSTEAQAQFISAGGATVLCQLLHHESAMIQKKVLKALLLVAQPIHVAGLLEHGTVDALFQVFFGFKKSSRRKQLTGEVLKSLAGCPAVPEDSARDEEGPSHKDARFWATPLWIKQGVGKEPAWDQEAIACLVDGVLMADSAPMTIKKVAERTILKLLSLFHHTRKVIVDKQLMDELVGAIKGQSSCSEALMKVATCLTLMHASNEVTFVRCGGLDVLVEAARSDSSGSVGGEMATWCLLHFVDAKEEHAVRAVLLGAVEALSQQLYSPEVTCRHAAAATLHSLLKRDDKSGAVKQRVVESNGIPALLSALQDTHPRLHQAAATRLILKILLDLVQSPQYKEEVERAGGQDMIKETVDHSDKEVAELSKKLLKRVGRTTLKESLMKRFSIGSRSKGRSKFSQGSFNSAQEPVKFDFDLEYYNIQASEASRAGSRFGDKVKSMFRRPASVSGGSVRGFPVSVPKARGPASDRGGLNRHHSIGNSGRRSLAADDFDNRSVGSDTQSVASLASTVSMTPAGRRQLQKALSGKGTPMAVDEDPFTPLRMKYTGSPATSGATTGGPPTSGRPPLRSAGSLPTAGSVGSHGGVSAGVSPVPFRTPSGL